MGSLMIKVVVADDHYLVRQGVRALLDNAEEIEVIGEAENGEEALRLVKELNPDVVVMDISMPEMDGIKATEKIHAMKDRRTRVVILSMYANVDLVEQALKKGATGYLLKRSTTTELVQAVVAANEGKRFLSSALGSDIPNG